MVFVSHRVARAALVTAMALGALAPAAAFAAPADHCTVQASGFEVLVVTVNASGTSSGESIAGGVCTYLMQSGLFHGVSKYTRIPANYEWVCEIDGPSGDYANVFASLSDSDLAEAFCKGAQNVARGNVTWYPSQRGA